MESAWCFVWLRVRWLSFVQVLNCLFKCLVETLHKWKTAQTEAKIHNLPPERFGKGCNLSMKVAIFKNCQRIHASKWKEGEKRNKAHLNKYFFYSVIGFLQVQSIQHVIVLSKVENTDVTFVTNVKNKSSILLSPKVRTYISAYENIHKNTA